MTTIREVVAAISKPGKVVMPVMTNNDVHHIQVVKSDLLFVLLSKYEMNDESPWYVMSVDEASNTTFLDIQS